MTFVGEGGTTSFLPGGGVAEFWGDITFFSIGLVLCLLRVIPWFFFCFDSNDTGNPWFLPFWVLLAMKTGRRSLCFNMGREVG